MTGYKLRTFAEIIDPKHTILLVHELLNAFVAPGGKFDRIGMRMDVSAIVPATATLIAAARKARVRVAYLTWTSFADGRSQNIWGRPHASGPDDPPSLPSTAYRDAGWGAPPEQDEYRDISTVEGTWGNQVFEPVKPEADDWVIRKYRPDAFFATTLDAFLRWNGFRTIIILGLGAEVGIVPTLITAAHLGYLRVAVRDCLRASRLERTDDAMRYITDYAIVKTHAEIIETWGGKVSASGAGAQG